MNERMTAIVGARISEFRRKMAEVRKTTMALPKRAVIRIDVEWDRANRRLDALANKLRTLQTLSQNVGRGALIAVSPTALPILATLVGALAVLGPMMGVLGGASFALASAFGVAGAGAIAFGSMAIPTIKELFEENDKLTKQQQKARKGWEKLSKTWKRINQEIEPQILDAFTKSTTILHDVLHELEPMFTNVANAVNRLLDSLKQSINTEPMQRFFSFLNDNSGKMVERMGKAIGNIVAGIANMAVAFEPLMNSMSKGFLDMTKRFADWGANLGKNKEFQSFINFVETNMPKISSIFGNMIEGIVNVFEAFGPTASKAMSGLEDMMKDFNKWAEDLEKNKSFQKFIDFIEENTPKVKNLIGNLADLFKEISSVMGPIGSDILDFLNEAIPKITDFLDNNPKLAKFVGWMTVFWGVLQALAPLFVVLLPLLVSMWKIFKNNILPVLKKLWNTFKKNVLPVLKKVWNVFKTRIIPVIVRIGSIFLRFIGGPVGLLVQAIILLAIIIWKNWDKIKKWTSETWDKIKKWLSSAWQTIKQKASETWDAIKKKIGDVWDKIKKSIKQKLDDTWEHITSVWDNITGYFEDIDLYSIGQDIIQGLINGIKSMGDSAWNAVTGIGSDIKNGFTNFFGINSPSKLMKQDVGQWLTLGIADGMQSKIRQLQAMTNQVSQAAMPQMAFSPAVEAPSVGTPTSYSSREETNVNMRGVFEGAELVIREEADIDRIAQALGDRVKQRSRARGI